MDASPAGCSTPPPWHIDAVGGRPHHQGGSWLQIGRRSTPRYRLPKLPKCNFAIIYIAHLQIAVRKVFESGSRAIDCGSDMPTARKKKPGRVRAPAAPNRCCAEGWTTLA